MEKELIIIPDVHGREFWKKAKEYINQGVKTIFLGDYLDPYSFEGISEEDAVANFEDIIDTAKKHENVQLLIGNHDCGYFFDTMINNCRTIYNYFYDIRAMFRDNKELFKLAYTENIGNIQFLFSHAGIDNRWLTENGKFMTGETVVDKVNSILDKENKIIIGLLGCVPQSRGGWTEYGSCVWQDIHDWFSSFGEYNGIPNTTQICGHTMQLQYKQEHGQILYRPDKPFYNESGNVYCLDCQQCFFIDGEGDIRYLETEEVVNK